MGASPIAMRDASVRLEIADEPPGAVDAAPVGVERVHDLRRSPTPTVEREQGERDVVGERKIPVELPGDLLWILGPGDLEVLRPAQGRDALAVLGPDPLHRPTKQVGEEEAVDQHRLGPGNWLLVPGHEAGPGGEEEVACGVGIHEVAGAEDVAELRAGSAVIDQRLEPDDPVADPHEFAALAMGRDVADLEVPLPPGLLEEQAEVVAAVEAAVDEVDADAL